MGPDDDRLGEPAPSIRVRGARDHNLKGIDVDIEHGAWTAVVGPSGSGKSTLVFDTLVREGERRYLGSLSAKARQFFGKLGRARADSILGLPVPIAVGQRSATRHPRSTVGTQSGVLDLLRLLFARSAESPQGAALTRSHFSFNTPLGACGACGGLGLEDRVEPSLLVADASKSIRAGALVPTLKNGYTVYSQVTVDVMDEIARAHGFTVDTPWADLTTEQQGVILYGTQALKVPFGKHSLESRMKWEGITARPREEGYYRGLIPVIEETLLRSRNDNILRFVVSAPCSACAGTRLAEAGRTARLGEWTLPGLLGLAVADLEAALDGLPQGPVLEAVGAALRGRLGTMGSLGLGHLAFDRAAASLSAGEAQRLRLAAHLVGGLTGALYALDEPTLGLHPENREGMRDVLRALNRSGNTLVVVEHDPDMVRCADAVIAMGPKAGPEGGEVVDGGPGEGWVLGGAMGESASPREGGAGSGGGTLELRGATLHNLRSADLIVHLGQLNVVMGPSGAGKSSLVLETLLPALRGERGGPFGSITVSGDLAVQAIDARPMGRSSRSTPATWSGVMDGLRKAFAEGASGAEGLSASDFSFNGKGGRCAACEGLGVTRVGLHLLEDAVQTCGECAGRRYDGRVLRARLGGKTIAEVLGLSVDDAVAFAHGESLAESVYRPLEAMAQLGIGYLKLGTPSTQLSSGEAQRIRLATLLAKERRDAALFVFDEPDRGLDPVDVARLLAAFDGLVARGHTVLAISHHRQIWAAADALVEVRDGVSKAVAWDALEIPELSPEANTSSERQSPSHIRVRGARTHNLKGVSIDVAHGAISVVVGPSGSGKSSLAFDTIAAEAMHRYAETLPFQVRRYMQQLPRPTVDSIDGLTPTIALRQAKATGASARHASSTLATQSGLGPLVRLLFARAGRVNGELSGLSQSHFSPDRAVGACPNCDGKGERMLVTEERLVTDRSLSLAEGALGGTKAGAFLSEPGGQYLATLRMASQHDLAGPWEELPQEVRDVALRGTGDRVHRVTWSYRRGGREGTHDFEGTWDGLLALAENEAKRRGRTKTGRPWLEVLEATSCEACGGVGLGVEALAVRIGVLGIDDVLGLGLGDLVEALDRELGVDPAWRQLRAEIGSGVQSLEDLGLAHLRLGTRAADLTPSELQRVRLASVLRSGLTSTTLVLDEPGAGLRDDELGSLGKSLRALADDGNTVLLVTHRLGLIGIADDVVHLGPGAGDAGGQIVDADTEGWSLELGGKTDAPVPSGGLALEIADGVWLPSSGLVVVDGAPGPVEELMSSVRGAREWSEVVDARSSVGAFMPLTALSAMADLQKLYHGAAKEQGLDVPKAAFSFLSPKGRCSACGGSGVDSIALDFMADLDVPCASCEGERYRPEVLEVRWEGRSVAELLREPIASVTELGGVGGRLQAARAALMELGLGHLSLGRRTATLSGGELQRLGLSAGFLTPTKKAARAGGAERLYLLDQPGRGLSEAELGGLLAVISRHAGSGALFLASGVHRERLRGAASEILDLAR